ncbi:MAG: MbcA/ParS/Xre antitoxin family protein [Pseudomonadota bacterium]
MPQSYVLYDESAAMCAAEADEMLFALNFTDEENDGAVLEEEWQTLLSFARSDRLELARKLRRGMSTKTLEALNSRQRINIDMLTDAGLLNRHEWKASVKSGRTTPHQSDLMVRYLRVLRTAEDIWGYEKAQNWIQRPNRQLAGESPLSLLDSDQGAQVVEALLGQIEHGIGS